MKSLFLFAIVNALFATASTFGDAENPDAEINPQAFFESIKGDYHIDAVTEAALEGRIDKANISMDPELPNTAIVSMPYCVAGGACFDSGNLFDYSQTKITQKEITYSIELTSGAKKLAYEWTVGSDGHASFKNLQFIGPSGKPSKLTHALKKQ